MEKIEDEEEEEEKKKKGVMKRSLYGDSKRNEGEVMLVREYVRCLVEDGGVRVEDVVVVSLYNV